MCHKDNTFSSGAFFGFVAGIVTGLLFAPTQGSETRKKVKKEYDERIAPVLERVSDRAQELSEPMKARFVEKIEQLTDEVGQKVEDVVDEKHKGLKTVKKKLFNGIEHYK